MNSYAFKLLLLGLVALGCTACSPRLPTGVYGESQGTPAKNSLNGLSVFREALQARGHRVIKIQGLRGKASRLKTIVWTPTTMSVPADDAIDWFEDWLAQPEERLLIWVGRDFDGLIPYYQQALQSTDESQAQTRWKYAETLGVAEAAHIAVQREGVYPEPSRWFRIEKQGFETSDSTSPPAWQDLSLDSMTWVSSYGPLPALPGDPEDATPASDTPTTDSEVNEQDFLSDEMPDEIGEEMIENIIDPQDKPTPVDYTYQTLLASSAGEPWAFSIASPRWSGNRIIVLRNGSTLLNHGAVNPGNHAFLTRLMDQMPAKGRVGLLLSSHDPWIDMLERDSQRLLGFEMFTVWPMSLITMLALAIGILAMAAMFPIYGRPLNLPSRSTEDFGAHVQALGELLQGSQDREFALHCIIHYFRRVRKEPNASWSQMVDPYQPPVAKTPEVPPIVKQETTLEPRV